ncbi:ABC transporter substrate-binding protein [Halopiger thermotolerans]
MTDDSHRSRRTILRTGATVAAAGLFAGCTSDGNGNGNSDAEGGNGNGNSSADTSSNGDGDSDDGSGDGSSESYSVTMEPVGTVEFDSVPEAWAANNGSWADMGIALGQQPPEAVYLTARYHTQYYDEIPDVSVDKSGMDALWDDELDPEEFVELSGDVDVFVMDPNFLINRGDWDQSDIDQIESMGTPFFGNSIFSQDYGWHDYEFLSLYEAFEKLAEVFQEQERYEAFASLHDEFQSEVESIVPPESERPDVAIVWPAGDGTFYPYTIGDGTGYKQWRDLGVGDALGKAGVSDFTSDRGTIDYENLLEIDPDVLLLRGPSNESLTAEEFQNQVVAEMENHDIASELTAVQNGDVYRGGPLYQGPIANLVLTERAAQDLYGVEKELFDRQRVSDIVNGNF